MTIYACCLHVGHPICPNDHIEITSQSVDQMADQVMALPERTKIQVLAPIVVKKKDNIKYSNESKRGIRPRSSRW